MCYSQSNSDTITYVYNHSQYLDNATSYVKKMIEANYKYGNGDKSLITNLAGVEIIVHPIFNFNKEIVHNNNENNLLTYLDLKNKPELQVFDVYYKNNFIYSFSLPDKINKESLSEKESKMLVGYLRMQDNPNNETFDYTQIFKDYFSFYVNNMYCVLIDNKVNVVSSISIPKHTEIHEFNSYFFPSLNFLKAQANGVKNPSYKDYIIKNKIPQKYLKVVYR